MEKPLNLAKALLINKSSSRRIVAHWFDISWSVCLSRGRWRGRDRPCRWWRNRSHLRSVANEEGITTRWRLIAPLFRNHNGWFHSDVIRTWLRWAGGCYATSPTCFYWIVLHWLSDDDMLYCSLTHICKALIHTPGAADSKKSYSRGAVRYFIAPIAQRMRGEIAIRLNHCVCLLLLPVDSYHVMKDGSCFNWVSEKDVAGNFICRITRPRPWKGCVY